MRLESLIEELKAELFNAACELTERQSFGIKLNTDQGIIDGFYSRVRGTYPEEWECEVIISHDNNEHYSENLEDYLSKQLYDCVDWSEVERKWEECYEDEYQRNGFSSAADFWRWKEGAL